MFVIFEVVICLLVLSVFIWAAVKPQPNTLRQRPSPPPDNVVSLRLGKRYLIEENLRMFLEAEEALARNEVERYLCLKMRAIESAKKNLSDRREGRVV